jgi:hypothetical protein
MATYVPKELRAPTAITASYATVYTATGVTGVMRSYAFTVLNTPHNAFLSREAGAAGTLIVNNEAIPTTSPLKDNGWWVVPQSGILQVKADSIATDVPNFGAWGLEYS